MMCFRDMTFCELYEDCKDGKKCHRALTPKMREAAKKWWNGDDDAPICIYSDTPKCFIEKDGK